MKDKTDSTVDLEKVNGTLRRNLGITSARLEMQVIRNDLIILQNDHLLLPFLQKFSKRKEFRSQYKRIMDRVEDFVFKLQIIEEFKND